MKPSEKKSSAIYTAVFDVLMDLRVELSREGLPAATDAKIAQAMDRAGQAAIKAYETPLSAAKGARR